MKQQQSLSVICPTIALAGFALALIFSWRADYEPLICVARALAGFMGTLIVTRWAAAAFEAISAGDSPETQFSAEKGEREASQPSTQTEGGRNHAER